MKRFFNYLVVFGFVMILFGCGQKNQLNYKTSEENNTTIYEIEGSKYIESNETTNLVKIDVNDYGIMIAELYPEIAPITVANYQKLVSEKYYDGLIFHRVIKDFMIQTGDPTGTGSGGSNETIKGEFAINGITNDLSHTRGVLSMARKGGKVETEETVNSASSQFFIVHQDSQHLDGNYAAFGKVINGLDVLDKVANVNTDSNDKPIHTQKVNSIRFVKEYDNNVENKKKEGE